MVNSMKYAIVALVFIGIAKLLQLYAFDAEKYAKSKKESFSNYYKKETESSTKQPKQAQSIASEKVRMNTESDASEGKIDTLAFEEEVPSTDNFGLESAGNSLTDLKNNYLAPLMAQLPEGQLREDIVIRYYKHEKDGMKVYKLRELGYYLHEKKATETAGLGSNTLYYGDGIPIEDIQIVAFTLLEEGIPLKAIKHTRFDWKVNAMEIGTDSLLVGSENLNQEEIVRFVKEYQ